MSDEFIIKALENAAADYVRLMIARDGLERQIAEIERQASKLNLKIISLASLCDQLPKGSDIERHMKEVAKTGLTAAVRSVLRASGDWMSARQVRDQVLKLGLNIDKYKNPLASIHTVLGRLHPKEIDAAMFDDKSNKMVFRWKEPESIWTKIQKLPPEEANEIVTETAKAIVEEQVTKKRKRLSKKK